MSSKSVEGEVRLEELENRAFTTKMRGYDPDEVQAFLADVARTLRDHKKQADRAYQAVGEEMGEMLQQARDRADAMIADAEQKAAGILADASAAAEETRSEAQAEAEETRSAAQAEATVTRGSADQDAARTRAEAERAAAEMKHAAEKEAARVTAAAAQAAEEVRGEAQRDADERTERADERVRALLSEEKEARERIDWLSSELMAVSQRLQGSEGADDEAETRTDAVLTAPMAAEITLDAAPDESANPAS